MNPNRDTTAAHAGTDPSVTTADPEPSGGVAAEKRVAAAKQAWVRPGRRRELIRSSRRRLTRGHATTRAIGSVTSTGRYGQPPRRTPQPHATTPDPPRDGDATATTHRRQPSSGRHRRRDHPKRLIAAVKLAKDIELGGLWGVLAANSAKPAVCVALATMALTHLVVTAAKQRAPTSRFTVVAALVKDIQLGGLWLTLAACSGSQAVAIALSAMALTHLVVTLSTCHERFTNTGTPQHVGGGITTGANEAANQHGAHAAAT